MISYTKSPTCLSMKEGGSRTGSLLAAEFLCYLRLMPVAFVLFCNRQQN